MFSFPTGCLGIAGTQTRMHLQGPSRRGACLKRLTLMGTAATMRMVQMGKLRPREGLQPTKVKQQWPLCPMGREPGG